MSVRCEACAAPVTSSGAMYAGEPTLVIMVRSEMRLIAAPKSAILISVPPLWRMLPGFKSRWVSPSVCAKASARTHLKMISATSRGSRSASGAQNFSSVPPSTYSITM
jgi:hypothetical protein